MNRCRSWLISAIALALISCVSLPWALPSAQAEVNPIPSPAADIYILVTNQKSGLPVANVEVALQRKGRVLAQGLTNEEGIVAFTDQRPGQFTIIVEKGETRTLSVGNLAVFLNLQTTKR